MNARKSLLFFCSILAGLALLCVCFPSDGLPLVGGIRLRFPALAEVMGKTEEQEVAIFEEADTLPPLTPEELLQMRQDSLNDMQMEKFRTYCSTDAARIYLPDDDETYLDELWETLGVAFAAS